MDTVDYGEYDGPCQNRSCERLGIWCTDPFAEEIWGTMNFMYLCEDCHQELKDDI